MKTLFTTILVMIWMGGSHLICQTNFVVFSGKGSDYVNKAFLNGVEINTTGAGVFSFNTNQTIAGENVLTFDYGSTNPGNGITTLDMVIIQRQLQDLVDLAGSANIIAGDFDRSGFIGVRDLIDMRELILGITAPTWSLYFALNEEKKAEYDQLLDPFDFYENVYEYRFDQSLADGRNFQFNTHVSGDANNSFNFRSDDDDVNRSEDYRWKYDDIYLSQGMHYSIPMEVLSHQDIAGLQLGMDISNLTDVSLVHEYEGDAVMTHLSGQSMKVSYLAEEMDATFVFTLNFVAGADGYLSEMIDLDSDFVQQGVNADYSTAKIKEEVNQTTTAVVNDEYNTLKVYPVPMTSYCTIDIPENFQSAFSIKILDVNGKTIYSANGQGSQYQLQWDDHILLGLYNITIENAAGQMMHHKVIKN